jgi:hypothetical protein
MTTPIAAEGWACHFCEDVLSSNSQNTPLLLVPCHEVVITGFAHRMVLGGDAATNDWRAPEAPMAHPPPIIRRELAGTLSAAPGPMEQGRLVEPDAWRSACCPQR